MTWQRMAGAIWGVPVVGPPGVYPLKTFLRIAGWTIGPFGDGSKQIQPAGDSPPPAGMMFSSTLLGRKKAAEYQFRSMGRFLA